MILLEEKEENLFRPRAVIRALTPQEKLIEISHKFRFYEFLISLLAFYPLKSVDISDFLLHIEGRLRRANFLTHPEKTSLCVSDHRVHEN